MATFSFNPEQQPELTFDDVFISTHNGFIKQTLDRCTHEEGQALDLCQNESDRFRCIVDLALKYGIGESFSRDQFDLTPAGGLANIPLVIANMNNVTGQRMAEAVARVGGIAAIPQDKTDPEMDQVIEYLRTRNTKYETPVLVKQDTKVHELRRLLRKRGHDSAIVMSDDGIVGLVTHSSIPEAINEDTTIERFVRSEVVTAKVGIKPLAALQKMEKQRVHYLPILDGDKIVGVLTQIGAAMQLRYKPNVDVEGGLAAVYTIGALNKQPLDRARFLFERRVHNILLDTAHFDQGIEAYRNIERVRKLSEEMKISVKIIAGNVVTREACRSIMLAGADMVKGGIGPGAMCKTRMVSGVGRPQVSMIADCADETHKHDGYFIADGGIKYPRDVSIALAVGADYVMAGSLFAGTHESPPDMQEDEKGFYKINRGMAAATSSMLRTLDRSGRNPIQFFRDVVGHRSEGSEGSKVYLKPGLERVDLLAHSLMDGPSCTGTYVNARTIRQLSENAVIGYQTRSGFEEGKPLDRL